MTIGGIVGILALAGAFAAAAVRRRDAFWAAMAGVLVVFLALGVARSGIDPTFVRDADDMVVVVGEFLMAGVVALGLGLPKSLEDRLLLGDMLPAWAFDQAIIRARQPFVAAAQVGDQSAAGKAHWLRTVTVPAPSSDWASLANGLEEGDVEWVDRQRSGAAVEDWLPWQTRTAQLGGRLGRPPRASGRSPTETRGDGQGHVQDRHHRRCGVPRDRLRWCPDRHRE